jgi:hypothetical protein
MRVCVWVTFGMNYTTDHSYKEHLYLYSNMETSFPQLLKQQPHLATVSLVSLANNLQGERPWHRQRQKHRHHREILCEVLLGFWLDLISLPYTGSNNNLQCNVQVGLKKSDRKQTFPYVLFTKIANCPRTRNAIATSRHDKP